ncbi:MAG: hypothetical protein OXT71_16790 [Acidobacteriota bacterium]|nr:hypothetical protein [Acidobacteriota bacterium]
MPRICFAMHEIRRSLIAAVLILPLSACAKPSYIKNASGTQLEGLLSAQQNVSDYQAHVDELFASAVELRREARVLKRTVETVKANHDPDPLEASAAIAVRIAQIQAQEARRPGPLRKLRPKHEEQMDILGSLLDMLYRSQSLIHEYIMTDIGPGADRMTEIGSGLERLLKRQDGGTPQ